MEEQHPIKKDSQKKICRRTGDDDRKTPVDGLAIERPGKILGRDRAFALVSHLDVPAQRKCRDRPLGAIAAQRLAPQRRAESHRKAQHFHIAQSRYEIVAEFVNNDQKTECDDERKQSYQEIHSGRFSWD